MKKEKIYQVNLLGNNNLSVSQPPMADNTAFYTTDTEAFINFITVDEGFKFDKAELTMINGRDRSVVVKNMVVDETQTVATYEIEKKIIVHHGRWRAQVVFSEVGTGEQFTSSPIQFDVNAHIVDGEVEQLIDIDGITEDINELTTRAHRILEELESIDDKKIAEDIEGNLNQIITDITDHFTKPNLFSVLTEIKLINGASVYDNRLHNGGVGYDLLTSGVSGEPSTIRLNNIFKGLGTYTFSGKYRGNQSYNAPFNIDANDSNISEKFYLGTKNEWLDFTHTFTITRYDETYNFIDINLMSYAYYEFKDLKVERGMRTPYVSAIEDVVVKVLNKNSGG